MYFKSAALEALQEAGESVLVELLENANLAANHAKEFIRQIFLDFLLRNFYVLILI